MTRLDDLTVLELSAADGGAYDSHQRIRRAYLRLAKIHHPDRGGTSDAFQNISSAYHRLIHNDEWPEEDDFEPWEEYSNVYMGFFRDEGFVSEGDYPDDYDDYFHIFFAVERDVEERRRNWSEFHKAQLKLGIDFRDSRPTANSDLCMFCGRNRAIRRKEAERNGLNWEEYKDQPYKTCWACKTNHACKKFAKKLEDDGDVFRRLIREGHTFHHRPVTQMYDGIPPENEYYWYPELEHEALAHGWKPRGKMKENVPWKRKDTRALVVAPRRKRKREAVALLEE